MLAALALASRETRSIGSAHHASSIFLRQPFRAETPAASPNTALDAGIELPSTKPEDNKHDEEDNDDGNGDDIGEDDDTADDNDEVAMSVAEDASNEGMVEAGNCEDEVTLSDENENVPTRPTDDGDDDEDVDDDDDEDDDDNDDADDADAADDPDDPDGTTLGNTNGCEKEESTRERSRFGGGSSSSSSTSLIPMTPIPTSSEDDEDETEEEGGEAARGRTGRMNRVRAGAVISIGGVGDNENGESLFNPGGGDASGMFTRSRL